VVIEAAAVAKITVPFLDVLSALQSDLTEEGIGLVVAGLPETVRGAGRRSRWFAAFEAAGWVQPTVEAAIERGRSGR
jgi:sulfate permease, SulP family